MFGLSTVKRTVLPLVRQQLAVLVDRLNRQWQQVVRQRLTALTADLLQLAGELEPGTAPPAVASPAPQAAIEQGG